MKVTSIENKALCEGFLAGKKVDAASIFNRFTEDLRFLKKGEASKDLLLILQNITNDLMAYELLLAMEKVELKEPVNGELNN
jgi:hypothetical protein